MSKSNPFAAPEKAEKTQPSPDEASPAVSEDETAPEAKPAPKKATKAATKKK